MIPIVKNVLESCRFYRIGEFDEDAWLFHLVDGRYVPVPGLPLGLLTPTNGDCSAYGEYAERKGIAAPTPNH